MAATTTPTPTAQPTTTMAREAVPILRLQEVARAVAARSSELLCKVVEELLTGRMEDWHVSDSDNDSIQ